MNSFVFLWMLTAQLPSDDKLPIDEVKARRRLWPHSPSSPATPRPESSVSPCSRARSVPAVRCPTESPVSA